LVKFTKNTIDSLVDKVRHESIATHRCTFDLKPLVSRYPMERCIGGKPVLRCGVAVPKAKEDILARSPMSAYCWRMVWMAAKSSPGWPRTWVSSEIRRMETVGWRREAARMQQDCPRLKKALLILYSIAHDIDTCQLSTRIMVYCLNRRLSKH